MIWRVWEATTAKRMQIDPYCQRQKCSTVNVVSSSIRVMQIFTGVGKISRFLPLSVNISKMVSDTTKVTIND